MRFLFTLKPLKQSKRGSVVQHMIRWTEVIPIYVYLFVCVCRCMPTTTPPLLPELLIPQLSASFSGIALPV